MLKENKKIEATIGTDWKETIAVHIQPINGYNQIHRTIHYKSGCATRFVIAFTEEELQLANESPDLLEENKKLLEAAKMVIDEWHSKKSNFNKKEPKYLQIFRNLIK